MISWEKNEAFCADLSKQQIALVVPAALRAAKLGDEKALDCYVSSNADSMPYLVDHPQWLEEYRQNTPHLIDTAVRNGDWVVVGLLQFAYQGVFPGTFLTQLIDPEPIMSYRYLQLQRLGASDKFAKDLDQKIALAKQELSTAQIANANAWARDTYARFFNGTPSNVNFNGVNTCPQDNN